MTTIAAPVPIADELQGVPRWVERYVRIPYSVADCWRLVGLVLQQRCGITVEQYLSITARNIRDIMRVMKEAAADHDTWLPVVPHWPRDASDVAPFDVVLMREFGGERVRHVGIMVTRLHVLHTDRDVDAVCVPLRHRSVVSRVVSFHRHVDLARQ